MRCVNSRRLTGPNLLWDHHGAVIDVEFGDVDADAAIAAWENYARQMLCAVGWKEQETCVCKLSAGASLAISAPLDCLYSATALNDWAWRAASDKLLREIEPENLAADSEKLLKRINAESNSRLLELRQSAERNNCTLLFDPDEVSIGMGASSQIWALDDLPDPATIDWSQYRDVPVALITGTNGKTTCSRLLSAIARAAGYCPGMSSTDGIVVDGRLVEKGDYSGPGGARAVLRHAHTEFAVLETARGGLLRRGLGVTHANAALITNIASDHIGQFGVNNLEELADVKWIVSRALGPDNTLVLNADDELLVKRGERSDKKIIWFSTNANNQVLQEHLAGNGMGCSVKDDHVVVYKGQSSCLKIPLADIPITYNGTALFNVANVLGITGLAYSMGIPEQSIKEGLAGFDESSNPGRTNFLNINGATVLVDFAHNTHGFEALLSFAKQLKAERRSLLIGHAGDRTDEDIRDMARAAHDLHFDQVIIKTLDRLRRGREVGEIEALLRDQFLTQGIEEKNLVISENEFEGVKAAIQWSQPGDLLVLLIHDDKQGVIDYLKTCV